MKKIIKASRNCYVKKTKGKPEKLGLPSDKQIKNSVYAKCGKK
jgi:hypothetical protein